jgi:hypothetical protein
MIYYRLAIHNRQTTQWTWKTTAVTSLQAVFQLLRIYRMLPQDGIRVFTAASKEDLREMLTRQNTTLASSSVTATQFLREKNLVHGHASTDEWRGTPKCSDAPCGRQAPIPQTTLDEPLARPEQEQSTSEQSLSAQAVQQDESVATRAKAVWDEYVTMRAAHMAQQGATENPSSSLYESITTTEAPASSSMSLLEQKRLEIECGPGGDHDSPYRFTFPISMKERLVWTHLQRRVQSGELPS